MMIARKIPFFLVSGLLVLVAAAQFTGCEKYVLPDLSITPDTLRFSAQADSADIYLSTNVITSPVVEEDSKWLSAWPEWFDADSPVTIYVKNNTDSTARTGIINFKSEALEKKLVVIQAAAVIPDQAGNDDV